MSNIEIPGRYETPAANGKRSASEGFQQSRWLKALEDAGLRDALRVARPYASDPAATSARDAARDEGLPAAERCAMAGETGTETTGPSRSRLAGETFVPVWGDSVLRGAAHAAEAADAIAPTTSSVDEGSGVAEDEAEPSASARTQEQTGKRNWQPRNIAVLPSNEGGVEVWVRDPGMAAPQLTALLAELRRSAAEAGIGLARVALNGRPVYSAPENERNRSESKEE